MCGIVGLIRFDGAPVSPVTLERMTDAVAHRGPDGEGHWVEGSIGFGHRRLAIIDTSPAGHQPMLTSDGRFVLTYNGEIYNYRELRLRLEAEGCQFRSSTDSEVVLQALATWGLKALDVFNGMFAFALWDRQEQKLLVARDRYGIKPLYIGTTGSYLAFGSEQKAILEVPGFPRELDDAGLIEYLTFQNILTDRTLLRNVKLLPAGCYATLEPGRDQRELRVQRYWDYQFEEPQAKVDDREYAEELDRLFVQAVQRQLIADVELGSYLSGGIDSGSITAIAAQHYPNLKTFTCGFDLSSASGMELSFDERAVAEAMSAEFKTEQYEMVLKSGDMERSLPHLAHHLEEPRVGQSYPNFYAAKLASKFVSVVLSGTGGDEMFGGYPWRYYRGASSKNFDDYISEYYNYWQRLVTKDELRALLGNRSASLFAIDPREIFRAVFDSNAISLNRPEDYINHSLYFEAKTFLHGLLVVEDKLSMAHSLESRVPFLDNDLVDFAQRCPVRLKINNLDEVVRLNENEPGNKTAKYFQRTNDGKRLLREVMSRHVPHQVVDAQKQGFSAPDASWFKGESIDFVRRRLMNPDAQLYKVLDYSTAQQILGTHLDGSINRRLFVWSMLSLDEYVTASLA